MIAFCIILGFFGVILLFLEYYFDKNRAIFGSLGEAALMARCFFSKGEVKLNNYTKYYK